MKYLLLSALFLSLNAGAQINAQGQAKAYSPNNGVNPPGTFESKETSPSVKQKTDASTAMDIQEEQMSPTSSESGIKNSSGITTDQMNTSPNTPPGSDQELMRDSTLSTGPVKKHPTNPAEIQAMDEENALDYNTAPEKGKKKTKKNKEQ
jgi:hypothetical protein